MGGYGLIGVYRDKHVFIHIVYVSMQTQTVIMQIVCKHAMDFDIYAYDNGIKTRSIEGAVRGITIRPIYKNILCFHALLIVFRPK